VEWAGEKVTVKHIYVSPHSDDVALSCGGEIVANSASSRDTMVLNVFTSDQQESHAPEKAQTALFDSINSERTSEDQSAWDSIGIESRYLSLPEALLRGGFPFRLLSGGRDPAVQNALHDAIIGYVGSYPDADFYFPAGIGNHVDHIICRDVAFRLLSEGILKRIFLYEDIPYCWLQFLRDQYYRNLRQRVDIDQAGCMKALRRDGETLLGYMTKKRVPFPRGKKLFPIVYLAGFLSKDSDGPSGSGGNYRGTVQKIALTADQVRRKKDLLHSYRSQIPMLFGSDPEELLHDRRESFATEIRIEVTKRPSNA
jgi:LmbE family N-acetylglucosaminyl deacetylase